MDMHNAESNRRWGRCGRMFFFGLLLLPPALLLLGGIVMALWNALVPGLFHLAPINFWQALGLLVLSRVLFGGFHGGHGRHRAFRRGEWMGMSEEERNRLREEWEKRHGGGERESAPAAP